MESASPIPIHEDCLRKGTHFHVIFGEESVFWHGSSLMQGPVANYMFSRHESAHKFFIGQIEAILPGFISEEEIEDSLVELSLMISDSENNKSSTRTSEGIWFEELDIKLAICHGCIPAALN